MYGGKGFGEETCCEEPLGRPKRRWEYNIKMNLQDVGCGAWTGSIWLRIGAGGGTSKCGNEPSGSIIRGDFLD
jgi:hypothetical protein